MPTSSSTSRTSSRLEWQHTGTRHSSPPHAARSIRLTVWPLLVITLAWSRSATSCAPRRCRRGLLPLYRAHPVRAWREGPSQQHRVPAQRAVRRSASATRHLGEFQSPARGARLQRRAPGRRLAGADRACSTGTSPRPTANRSIAGLSVHGMDGARLYDADPLAALRSSASTTCRRCSVQTLLYIENRELLSPVRPARQPGDRVGPHGQGEPALHRHQARPAGCRCRAAARFAIQLEKYRHSPNGRTNSPLDKLRQVAGASLRRTATAPTRANGGARSWSTTSTPRRSPRRRLRRDQRPRRRALRLVRARSDDVKTRARRRPDTRPTRCAPTSTRWRC